MRCYWIGLGLTLLTFTGPSVVVETAMATATATPAEAAADSVRGPETEVSGIAPSGPPPGTRVYQTSRLDGPPPVLDGRLADPAWSQVEWADGFIQRSPDEGEDPTEKTAFKILYDDHFLYVAYRAYDSEPEKICSQVARRDYFPGDWVEINIDSYFDHRTAFSFTTSASGVKGDEFVSEDGQNWDGSWDPIWLARTAEDQKGWTAEIKIPFSQLRYSDRKEQIWGIQVTRRLYREEERSNWQFIPQDAPGWVSQFGELHGIRGIRPQRQIEFLPYLVSKAERFEREEGNPFATGSSEAVTFGLDGKVGITSDLTLDLTINPDFGQVEADPSEVNLSAFETFFEEKRPFFIEGRDIFDLRLAPAITGGGFTSDRLFYSRRIGRPPQGEPELEEDEHADVPENTSIIGALKLSGKTKQGWSIGLLESVTARERAELDLEGQRRRQTIEPATNFFVGRLQKDYRRGATVLGAMLTATNRRIEDPEVEFLHAAAYAGGVDFLHTWKDRTYYLSGNLLLSHVRGDESAILDTQTASARYYQRPDAGYISLDSTRTSLSGHSGSLRLGKRSNGPIRFETGAAWRSPGFEINDLGFMRAADEINQFTWAGYYITKPFSVFRTFSFNTNQWTNYDFGGRNTWNAANANSNATFRNNWSCGAGVTRSFDYISNTELRGGPSSKWPGDVSANFWINSDSRRGVFFGLGGDRTWGDEGYYDGRGGWFEVNLRPNDVLRVTLGPSYSTRDVEMQYLAERVFGGTEARYLFGTLEQKTASLTLRADYALTPNLTVQLYGEPFVSAGKYRDFKRINDPKASRYRDRFRDFEGSEISYDASDGTYLIDEDRDGEVDYEISDPDFNVKAFNSNLVVRWEFSPGSLVYLVWSQGRSGTASDGSFSFRRDIQDLFEIHPHDIFLLKVSRWLSI